MSVTLNSRLWLRHFNTVTQGRLKFDTDNWELIQSQKWLEDTPVSKVNMEEIPLPTSYSASLWMSLGLHTQTAKISPLLQYISWIKRACGAHELLVPLELLGRGGLVGQFIAIVVCRVMSVVCLNTRHWKQLQRWPYPSGHGWAIEWVSQSDQIFRYANASKKFTICKCITISQFAFYDWIESKEHDKLCSM